MRHTPADSEAQCAMHPGNSNNCVGANRLEGERSEQFTETSVHEPQGAPKASGCCCPAGASPTLSMRPALASAGSYTSLWKAVFFMLAIMAAHHLAVLASQVVAAEAAAAAAAAVAEAMAEAMSQTGLDDCAALVR